MDFARRIISKLGVASGGKERQPGERTIWGKKRQLEPDGSRPNDLGIGGVE